MCHRFPHRFPGFRVSSGFLGFLCHRFPTGVSGFPVGKYACVTGFTPVSTVSTGFPVTVSMCHRFPGFRFGFDQDLAVDKGGRSDDVCIGGNEFHGRLIVGERVVAVGWKDGQMGVEAQNAVAPFLVEPAHDRNDNDQHGHAQQNSDNGYDRNHRNKSPARSQIAES